MLGPDVNVMRSAGVCAGTARSGGQRTQRLVDLVMNVNDSYGPKDIIFDGKKASVLAGDSITKPLHLDADGLEMQQ